MSSSIRVAVYGTLRRGEYNNRWLSGSTYLSSHRAKDFSMYSNGGYPYAVTGGKGITVEIFCITEDILKDLDRLEGYPRHYNRKIIDIDGIKAWVYFMDTAPRGSYITKVPSGDWLDAERVGSSSEYMA